LLVGEVNVPEENSIIGTSFESFTDAAASAFAQVQGDRRREGAATARVARMWLEKGGIVGRTQYRVELLTSRPIKKATAETTS
jgi:hypothetical protein